MERGTVKTRTIFIATRGKTELYHAVEEVPPGLRRKLLKSTTGSNCGTVLIADRRGLQELIRTGARQRPAERASARRARRLLLAVEFVAAHWPEIGLSAAFLLLVWLAVAAIR